LPDNFCFEWASDPSTARYAGICHTKDELLRRLGEIAENFEFHSYRPTEILVDGDRAAAQLQLDLTSAKTRQRFSARIAHFWSFEDGIPVHLVEYGHCFDSQPERLVERVCVQDSVVEQRILWSGRGAREPRPLGTLTALRAAAEAAECV
jgi:hypothetical protein